VSMARALAFLLALGIPVASAEAQTFAVGAAIQENIQRFDGDASLNRLDGASIGWLIIGGAQSGPWVVRGEGSRDATIRNVQSTPLTLNGRPITVQSELSHDMRDVAALAGYARDVTSRLGVTFLGGVAAVTVHRAFTTDAGQLVLIPPSTIPPTAVTTTFVDRFGVWTAEVNVALRATSHLEVFGGLRVQPIALTSDLNGRSVRTFGGILWRLK
jgi:hypothetical protein